MHDDDEMMRVDMFQPSRLIIDDDAILRRCEQIEQRLMQIEVKLLEILGKLGLGSQEATITAWSVTKDGPVRVDKNGNSSQANP